MAHAEAHCRLDGEHEEHEKGLIFFKKARTSELQSRLWPSGQEYRLPT